MSTVPKVGCIAQLHDVLLAMDTAPDVDSVVAEFEHGGRIIVKGKFVGRGSNPYFGNPTGIRWECPEHGSKGLFGRGIACYMTRQPAWIDQLPRCK